MENRAGHDRYYRWRDRLSASRKAETADEQILPRQKAILNGNKITTEIWNYGSISSPGNRVTDIVWETLGYGYEFGPFSNSSLLIVLFFSPSRSQGKKPSFQWLFLI